MTDINKFLQLAVIEQKKYAEIEKEIGVDRTQLSKWWDESKEEREKLSKLRQVWTKKCSETDFWKFHEWHTKAERQCYYCGINEEQIKVLINSGQIRTKRLTTRGRTLEIERREPNKEYDDIDNLVFCCYWCNNAKSDEFSDIEFKPIAERIAEVWKKRLETI